jgi:hypothetical protein
VPIAMRPILQTKPVNTSALSAHVSKLAPRAAKQRSERTMQIVKAGN